MAPRWLSAALSLIVFSATAFAQDGVKIEVLEKPEDCALLAKAGDNVHIHYTGSLEDGKVFDSSKGRDAFTFRLGAGKVIRGFDDGVMGMCIGEKRKVTIPPHLGYGKRGVADVIPPDSTLVFEIELTRLDLDPKFAADAAANYKSDIALISVMVVCFGCLGFAYYRALSGKGFGPKPPPARKASAAAAAVAKKAKKAE
eukprot:comp20028_c0_seq1/m.24581 comp20028_c0_seq1/g.24581  ORF comp20028_c0_seq1/g.24581 comp20028_c0_seq1/m.24581 type:complete len:199 (-) comp20028_c0_seq1:413-1009(-)